MRHIREDYSDRWGVLVYMMILFIVFIAGCSKKEVSNAEYSKSRRLFFKAIDRNDSSTVKTMVSDGFEINRQNGSLIIGEKGPSYTVLHYAILKKN